MHFNIEIQSKANLEELNPSNDIPRASLILTVPKQLHYAVAASIPNYSAPQRQRPEFGRCASAERVSFFSVWATETAIGKIISIPSLKMPLRWIQNCRPLFSFLPFSSLL
ncbi:hypothetical protein WN944_000880 [Citrus x changshan-huyou]|uniref:Uncharacterized protein n=1 Tax=Citrus x changshan-huyou TaxID=2935761 RepID=A0AAP0MFD4_9ROSI